VDEFRRCFTEHAASVLSPADLVPEERVDAVIPGDAAGIALAEEIERLRPFGQGNPRPTLLVPAACVTDVRPMGEEKQHASFTLVGGGSRARTVAFRREARSLPASPEERNDAAVRLELNEWNGAVEPRLVLRALSPTQPGVCEDPAARVPFWDAFGRALDGSIDPPAAGAGGRVTREVRDRRGQGFAGVCGDLLSSGETVLVLCADGPRRRATLELVVAGLGAGSLEVASWDDLEAHPSLADPFMHLVALDPPCRTDGADWALGLGDGGFLHLVWGPTEEQFALAVAERTLDPRDELVVLYRALRKGDEPLEALLRGDERHPRSGHQAGRLVRIMAEAGLVSVAPAAEGYSVELLAVDRTDLRRSATYVRSLERLEAAREQLGAAAAHAA
jgi:single-stranded-DNA-specific exonuclease